MNEHKVFYLTDKSYILKLTHSHIHISNMFSYVVVADTRQVAAICALRSSAELLQDVRILNIKWQRIEKWVVVCVALCWIK